MSYEVIDSPDAKQLNVFKQQLGVTAEENHDCSGPHSEIRFEPPLTSDEQRRMVAEDPHSQFNALLGFCVGEELLDGSGLNVNQGLALYQEPSKEQDSFVVYLAKKLLSLRELESALVTSSIEAHSPRFYIIQSTTAE